MPTAAPGTRSGTGRSVARLSSSSDLVAVAGTEEQRDADLGVELRVAHFLALEAHGVDRRVRHLLQRVRQEPADVGIAAAQRQRDAVRREAGAALLQPVLALRQVEPRGARDSVEALELVGEAVHGGERLVEAPEVRAARRRDGLDVGAGVRLLRRDTARLQLALRGPDGREVERQAREQHARAEHAGEAEAAQRFAEGLHADLHFAAPREACTENWIGCDGLSAWTWWLTM